MHEIKPAGIVINASSICQLECPECPTTELRKRLKDTGADRYLRLEDFARMAENSPWLSAVEFSNHGELFLNPDLPEILEYAWRKGVRLSANGGVNLNDVAESTLEALVKYRFSSMYVALDGTTQATYSAYRLNGSIEKVLDNIRTINDLKRLYSTKVPRLIWQFLVFGHNEDELAGARAMARELGMEFSASLPFHFVDGRPFDSDISPVRDAALVRDDLGYASLDEYAKAYGRDYLQFACSMLWDGPLFNHDGTCWGCCILGTRFLGEGDFGSNAFSDGLLESINCARMDRAREMLSGKAEPSEDVPCSKCWLYAQRRDSGRWLRRNALTNEMWRLLWRLYYRYDEKPTWLQSAASSVYRLLGTTRQE